MVESLIRQNIEPFKTLNKYEKEKSFWNIIENNSGKEKATEEKMQKKMHITKLGGVSERMFLA